MLMTVAELRRFIETEEDDQVLEAKLQALELLIRAYTNNNFQVRAYRTVATSVADENALLVKSLVPFSEGDTLQISESELQSGMLVTVADVREGAFTVNEDLADESEVVVTKVSYPMDVKMGAVNLMKWELNNRDKVGVSSETISRHSVTYFDMSEGNSSMGYPKALLGFLRPYKRARFGQGLRV